MDSPRSGLRRATAASWALAGLGVAGVAGASTLAWADTVKPPVESSFVAIEAAPPESAPAPGLVVPAAPAVTEAPPAPPVTTETTVEPAPVVPDYTPQPTVTYQAPKPTATTPPTTKRRTFAPTTVLAPSYSPRITVSRGS